MKIKIPVLPLFINSHLFPHKNDWLFIPYTLFFVVVCVLSLLLPISDLMCSSGWWRGRISALLMKPEFFPQVNKDEKINECIYWDLYLLSVFFCFSQDVYGREMVCVAHYIHSHASPVTQEWCQWQRDLYDIGRQDTIIILIFPHLFFLIHFGRGGIFLFRFLCALYFFLLYLFFCIFLFYFFLIC